MTTKPPSLSQEFPPDSLEKIAYASVAGIPTEEPNDRNRLGYHIWRWLKNREGSLEEAISESGSRIQISHTEAAKIVRQELEKGGIRQD
jgi:rRNA maturation endonuclease Nob1